MFSFFILCCTSPSLPILPFILVRFYTICPGSAEYHRVVFSGGIYALCSTSPLLTRWDSPLPPVLWDYSTTSIFVHFFTSIWCYRESLATLVSTSSHSFTPLTCTWRSLLTNWMTYGIWGDCVSVSVSATSYLVNGWWGGWLYSYFTSTHVTHCQVKILLYQIPRPYSMILLPSDPC